VIVRIKVWHPVAELFASENHFQFDRDVTDGMTLGELLAELADENHVWDTGVWSFKNGLSTDIYLTINKVFLRPDLVASRVLKENDVIGVRRILHGG